MTVSSPTVTDYKENNMTTCAALVRVKMSEKEWNAEYRGKTIPKPIGLNQGGGNAFFKRCSKVGGNSISRDGLQFMVCGSHTNLEKTCLIADFGKKPITALAEVKTDRGYDLVNPTTGETVVTMVELGFEEKEAPTAKPWYVIAFTGHRPQKLGGYEVNPLRTWVKIQMLEAVKRAIAKYGESHRIGIVTGGAIGVDQWAARLAQHLNLPYVVVAPFNGQDSAWPYSARREYNEICVGADAELAQYVKETIRVPFAVEGGKIILFPNDGYAGWRMQVRNEVMVNMANAVIAVWDGTTGGTANCVNYAKKVHRPMVHINPRDFNKEVK